MDSKYRKKILIGPVAIRVRDLIHQVAMEHDFTILSGKVSRAHIHLFISYHPHKQISKIIQWRLKGTSSRVLFQEFPHLRKQLLSRHAWVRRYLAVSSGTING